jgi:hypothetical protein
MPRISTKEYRKLKGHWSIRYVDNIVIVAPTREYLAEHCVPALKEFLAVRDLKMSKTKTKILNLDETGFEYLG